MMSKLSDNAWIPISKARQLAADADLDVAFWRGPPEVCGG